MMFKFGLLFVLMMAWWGATVNMNGVMTAQEVENISTSVYQKLENNTFNAQGNDVNATFIERAIGKYADFMMFLGATAQKEGMIWGYNHPTEAYRYVLILIFISMMAPLIIPIIYVAGLSFYCAEWAYRKIKGVSE